MDELGSGDGVHTHPDAVLEDVLEVRRASSEAILCEGDIDVHAMGLDP